MVGARLRYSTTTTRAFLVFASCCTWWEHRWLALTSPPCSSHARQSGGRGTQPDHTPAGQRLGGGLQRNPQRGRNLNARPHGAPGERHRRPPHCVSLWQGHLMGGAQPGPADRLGHQTGGIYLLVRFPRPLPGDEVRRGTCLFTSHPCSQFTLFIPFQFNWILTNLDAHTVDFRPFKYDYTNFTVLRLVDFTRPFVQHSLRSIVTEVSSDVQCTMLPLSTRMLLWSKFSMYFGQLVQEHSIQN